LRIFLISDNADTQTGMRLAGIDGILVNTPEEVRSALNDVLSDPKIGMLLVTEKIAEMQQEFISEIKMNRRTPLIVEVPDRHGSNKTDNYIMEYVATAIGLKL